MRRWMAGGVLAAMLFGLLPGQALAGSGGRKNTALLFTGGALYTWLNGGFKHAGRRNTALALTAASVVAWHKYKQARRTERREARLARLSSYDYARPVYSRTRSYRGYYRSAAYRGRSSRRRSNRYCQGAYRRGYRAGYRAGLHAAT
jgi:hypothetical protein